MTRIPGFAAVAQLLETLAQLTKSEPIPLLNIGIPSSSRIIRNSSGVSKLCAPSLLSSTLVTELSKREEVRRRRVDGESCVVAEVGK